MTLPRSLDTTPMEAKTVSALPSGRGWQFEPKWDGFRCIALKEDGTVRLLSKSGRPLGRYFPDVVRVLEGLAASDFALDGELVIPDARGHLNFEQLQLRLHPAESRVRDLAAEYPAIYVLFDMLAGPGQEDLSAQTLASRRAALEAFFEKYNTGPCREALWLSPVTTSEELARGWLQQFGNALDGVIAKWREDTYRPGERAMLKFKNLRSADCVIGGFRYGSDPAQVGSLLLGLYDMDGKLHHVGFTSGIRDSERREITERLEALIQPPGFTGKSPGGHSRWSTERSGDWQPLRPELVVEVIFDHVTGDRFRHGTRLHRWRPDKSPALCTMEQLRQGDETAPVPSRQKG